MDKEKTKDYSLEAQEQKRLKGISKCISVLAKIAKVLAIIGIVGIVFAMIIIPLITSNIKTEKEGNETILKVFDGKISYKRTENSFELFEKGKESEGLKVTGEKDVDALNKIFEELEKNDLSKATMFIEVELFLVIVVLFIEVLILKRVSVFFKNIHDESSPFTKENVDLLRGIAKLLIYSFIASLATSFVSSIVFKSDTNVSTTTIIEILVAFFSLYIFKYGYKLQEDSKGKIYSKGE